MHLKSALLLTFGLLLTATTQAFPKINDTALNDKMSADFSAGAGFVENRGQLATEASFYLASPDGTILFTPSGPTFTSGADSMEGDSLRLQFAGMNEIIEWAGSDPRAGVTHFYRGNDPKKWATNVRSYSRLTYSNVYDGIDVVYSVANQHLKSEYHVAAGADWRRIRLVYQGAEKIEIRADGALMIDGPFGQLVEAAPIAYQEIEGERVAVNSCYQLFEDNGAGFHLSGVHSNYPLVIDPELVSAFSFGGSGRDVANAVAVDADGNYVITGSTASTDFPTSGDAVQGAFGGGGFLLGDIFVTRINPDTQEILYSTYLGGEGGNERGVAVSLDESGNIYILGGSDSADFPVFNALQETPGGQSDLVLVKLDASGALVASTFLGGEGFESAGDLVLGEDGNLYLTGTTQSSSFPVVNPFQPQLAGGSDGFVTVVNSELNAIVYSTFLGGSGSDFSNGIALDDQMRVYLTGDTSSDDFPVVNALQPSLAGDRDAFFASLNREQNELVFSSYLGGNDLEGGEDIARDEAGRIYLTGSTNSVDFPLVDPVQAMFGGVGNRFFGDAFVSIVEADGSQLLFSTFVGGTEDEVSNSILIRGNTAVFGGFTFSPLSDFEAVFANVTSSGALGAGDGWVATFQIPGPAAAGLQSTSASKSPFQQGVENFELLLMGGPASDIFWSLEAGGTSPILAVGGTRSSSFETAAQVIPFSAGTMADPLQDEEEDDDAVVAGVEIALKAELQVTKSVSNSTPVVGETITYFLRVENVGNAPGNFFLEDMFCEKLEAVKLEHLDDSVDPPNCQLFSEGELTGKLTCRSTEPIQPGSPGLSLEDVFIRYTARVAEVGQCPNVVKVAQQEQDLENDPEDTDQVTITALAAHPDLSIRKVVKPEGPVSVGQEFFFTVLVTNSGNTPLKAKFEDILPLELGVKGIRVDISEGTTCTVPDPEEELERFHCMSGDELEPGETMFVDFVVVAREGGSFTNEASLLENEGDEDASNDTASASIFVGDPLVFDVENEGEFLDAARLNPDKIRIAAGFSFTSPPPKVPDKTIITGSKQSGESDQRVALQQSGEELPVIDGSQCAGCDGLILGSDSIVEGVAIENFDGYGLVLEDGGGNWIQGSRLSGNGKGAILIRNSNDNLIGGLRDAQNTLESNNGPAVVVESGTGNQLLDRNTLQSNQGLGIDLAANGPTLNDFLDTDSGANNLQNFPMPDVFRWGNSITIEGSFHGAPESAFRLEFFSNQTCDPSGFGEGENFLGSTLVTTDVGGNADFSVTFDSDIPKEHFITSTATDLEGNTSEFSPCAAGTVIEDPMRLFFPLGVGEGEFAGYAVTSLSDGDEQFEFRAFNPLGGRQNFSTNPGRLELVPGSQSARTSNEIFATNASEQIARIELASSTPQVGSFFQFGSGALDELDGGTAQTETYQTFYLPRVFEGPAAFRGQAAETRIQVANPGPVPLKVTFGYFAAPPAGGNSLAVATATAALEVTRDIPPHGFIEETVSQLFGEELSGGYIRGQVIEGNRGVVAFQRIRLPERKTVLGLNAPTTTAETTSFSAQLASGTGLFTNVQVINASEEARQLTATAIAEDGSNLAEPVTFTLEAGESLERDSVELFDFGAASASGIVLSRVPAQEFTVGSLVIVANGDGVIGNVIFGDPDDFKFAAALPLQTRTFTRAVFSQVADLPGLFFTGLAFFNPGSSKATFQIQVFSAQGDLVGEATEMLEAGRRISRLIVELVEEAVGQTGGYILITSDVPLVAQQLFGTNSLSLMSAVPPTVLE